MTMINIIRTLKVSMFRAARSPRLQTVVIVCALTVFLKWVEILGMFYKEWKTDGQQSDLFEGFISVGG